MVYISKVYTRFGDAGQTMLGSGDTVAKDALRVTAYGEIDEVNAQIAALHQSCANDLAESSDILDELMRIQHDLFDVGAELSCPGEAAQYVKCKVDAESIVRLETAIDALNGDLEPLKSFILPGGGPASVAAHIARTVCRRAERNLVSLVTAEPEGVRPELLKFVNRLADYLFVVGRACALRSGRGEVLWQPGAGRLKATSDPEAGPS